MQDAQQVDKIILKQTEKHFTLPMSVQMKVIQLTLIRYGRVKMIRQNKMGKFTNALHAGAFTRTFGRVHKNFGHNSVQLSVQVTVIS